MSADPEVVIEASPQALADATAARTVAVIVAAQREGRLAHVVVTGGSILEAVLDSLGASAAAGSIDWSRVALWWGDERFVPPDSDERNDKVAFERLFARVPLTPANVHRMPAVGAPWGEDLDEAAAAYAAELRLAAIAAEPDTDEGVPRFDVVLLGMGPDGHCASLFPGAPGVHEDEADVIAVRNSPKPPPNRVSLTFRGLCAANEIWVIASGSGKADAVAQGLGGAPRELIPVAGARGRSRTLWLLDSDAAAQLPDS